MINTKDVKGSQRITKSLHHIICDWIANHFESFFQKNLKKRFEDYKILDPETSEINRKKFTKIVKSEINKISQICENSHNAL